MIIISSFNGTIEEILVNLLEVTIQVFDCVVIVQAEVEGRDRLRLLTQQYSKR
jgi:hypothetical protein